MPKLSGVGTVTGTMLQARKLPVHRMGLKKEHGMSKKGTVGWGWTGEQGTEWQNPDQALTTVQPSTTLCCTPLRPQQPPERKPRERESLCQSNRVTYKAQLAISFLKGVPVSTYA